MATRISIIGITGYTGLELLRLLNAHKDVQIVHVTSRQYDGTPISEVYPHLAHMDLKIENPDLDKIAEDSDVAFLCLPHKASQGTVAALCGKTKVIDLSADFRLKDIPTYEHYYETPHEYPDILKDAVYGAPEIVPHEQIENAQVVANPGCFALLSQFLLYPMAGMIEHADIMAITGSSGSGYSAKQGTHHPVRSHNLKSYNVNKHRHMPEICTTAKITEEQLNFVPSSGPFARGIFATAFVRTKEAFDLERFSATYAPHPFVRVMDTGAVELANIVGSNFCDVSIHEVAPCNYIVQGALDNLIKGASGCAVQNMNIMCGYDETEGLLCLSPVYP